MMLIFWGVAITMIGIAVAVVTIPLGGPMKTPPKASASPQPENRRKFLGRKPHFYIAIIVPVLSLGLYPFLGSPGDVSAGTGESRDGQLVRDSRSSGQAGKPVPSVGSLVGGLQNRLQQEPDDADGWLLLARSYHYLGRDEEAITAYDRASALGRTNASLEESLYAGRNSRSEAAVGSGPSLRGRVTLSPDSAARVNQDDTVFIFAKESPKDRMPVLALRRRAADLPIDFVLTDEQAMVPGTRLADFESLVVTARISRTGFAMDAIDGLEAWSEPVAPIDGGKILLRIGSDPEPGNRGNE